MSQNEPGSRSPASGEAKEQRMSGHQGGPNASQQGGGDGQAPQGSQRVENQTEPRMRKGFEAGQAPSEQGRGSPKPDTIAEHQQGIGARSGSTAGRTDDSEEQASRGEPGGEHARHGRHDLSGDRQRS